MGTTEVRDSDPDQSRHDLRAWLDAVEQDGGLLRVASAVSPDEEMSATTYMVARTANSHALLFEDSGTDFARALNVRNMWNMIGPSYRRLALTVGIEPGSSPLTITRYLSQRFGRRVEPRTFSLEQAPVAENTLCGEDIDLTLWPFARHWPRDGGCYGGTGDIVITRDAESGVVNVGTYRMMVQGRDAAGIHISPGKDARVHLESAWGSGEALPVAAAWGIHPALMLAGSQKFPRDASEYEYVGGVLGTGVPVFGGTATGLPIPAYAELAIEGRILPGEAMDEGPFGEFTGYYGGAKSPRPVVRIDKVYYRNSPIITNALMGEYPSNEQEVFYSVARAARIWRELLDLGIVGITGVFCHPAAAAGLGMTVVAVEQQYPGHSEQVLNLAAHVPSGAYFTKWVIVVDADVDPSDTNQVIWALSTRCSPIDSISILRDTWNTSLDVAIEPPEDRPYGSRALVNACSNFRYRDRLPRRTLLRRSVYERVRDGWSGLGLPGTAPNVEVFDETDE